MPTQDLTNSYVHGRLQLSPEILRATYIVKKMYITSVEDLRDIIRKSQSALFRDFHTVFVTFDGEFDQLATGFLEMCVASVQGAAMYVDGKRVVTNTGAAPQTCGKVGMVAGRHRLQLRMIYQGGMVKADVQYRHLEIEGAALAPLMSSSPGPCTLPGERLCFPPPPIDKCTIDFPEETVPGKPVDSWSFSFLLSVPLEPGQYMDFILSDFTANSTSFALPHLMRATDPAYIPTLPHRKPKYAPLGCFKDVATARALGGKCGTFPDAGCLVTSVEACAEYAVQHKTRGFCVSEGHQCFTSRSFFLDYDR
jgi:hypothetical protein